MRQHGAPLGGQPKGCPFAYTRILKIGGKISPIFVLLGRNSTYFVLTRPLALSPLCGGEPGNLPEHPLEVGQALVAQLQAHLGDAALPQQQLLGPLHLQVVEVGDKGKPGAGLKAAAEVGGG